MDGLPVWDRPAELRQQLGRWITEFAQERSDKALSYLNPFPQQDSLWEGWLRRELALHINIGVGSGFSDVDRCELCADVQLRGDEEASRDSAYYAIPRAKDFV